MPPSEHPDGCVCALDETKNWLPRFAKKDCDEQVAAPVVNKSLTYCLID